MVFFNGKQGQKMYSGAKMFLYRFYRSADLLNAWTSSNPDASVYRLSNTDENENLRVSDYFLEDASFVRLRNLQLGYTSAATHTAKYTSTACGSMPALTTCSPLQSIQVLIRTFPTPASLAVG